MQIWNDMHFIVTPLSTILVAHIRLQVRVTNLVSSSFLSACFSISWEVPLGAGCLSTYIQVLEKEEGLYQHPPPRTQMCPFWVPSQFVFFLPSFLYFQFISSPSLVHMLHLDARTVVTVERSDRCS